MLGLNRVEQIFSFGMTDAWCKVVFFNPAFRKKIQCPLFCCFCDPYEYTISAAILFLPQFPSHFIANKKNVKEVLMNELDSKCICEKYKLRWFQEAPFSVFLPTPWKFVVNRWLCLCPFVEKCIQKMAIINCIHQSNSSALQPRRICSRISGISKQYIIHPNRLLFVVEQQINYIFIYSLFLFYS